MTNLDSIFKKQKYYFPNKGPSSQTYCFSNNHVWMWELNHKESESQRIDAFELWCWRRLLRVPWTAQRSNQSIRKEISPEYSLQGLMLKLKLQYFGHLMQRADSFEKTLMLGKIQRRQWHPTPLLLSGKSHGQRSLEGYSPWGHWGSDTTERLHFHFSLSCIGEGNGNPLQCSCLENPRDGGAWWASVYGVTQSRTWLKWLSMHGKDWRWVEKGTTEDEILVPSPTQRTWVWVNSGNWWWTGKPGILQSMGSQRVRRDWATEPNWDISAQVKDDWIISDVI